MKGIFHDMGQTFQATKADSGHTGSLILKTFLAKNEADKRKRFQRTEFIIYVHILAQGNSF